MKHISLSIVIVCSMVHSTQASYFIPKLGNPDETVAQARERFSSMTARQMHNVPIERLTPNQQQAFKELAKEYFTSEVACPGCSNQANRRKYEIMYQKIGELDFAPKAG